MTATCENPLAVFEGEICFGGKGMKDEASGDSQGRLALLQRVPGQAPVPSPQEEAVKRAASPWSLCVNRKDADAPPFLGGVWVL